MVGHKQERFDLSNPTSTFLESLQSDAIRKLNLRRINSLDTNPELRRKDNIKTMGESTAKQLFKCLVGKPRTGWKGSYFCFLWSSKLLTRKALTGNEAAMKILSKKGYDISTAYND